MNNVGVGLRAVAVIVDSVILFVVGYVIASMTGGTTAGGFQLNGAPAFLWFLINFAYFIVMEAQMGGTVGKLMLGLRVVKEGGGALDWQASIVRNILRIVDSIPFVVPYLLGAIFIWTSDKRQRLGDRVANTVVVKK
jgi:uncharacterized RDD family membrane protein YckC